MKIFLMMVLVIIGPMMIFGGGIAIFVGKLYVMKNHIFGTSVNHGPSSTYKIEIIIPIGWIVGTGALFLVPRHFEWVIRDQV